MPKVTVAMASFNHEKFVGEAIESVLSQEGCDFDFVIVDDGSKDGTVDEILKYHDPRIKFTALEKNQGACVALRKAIEGGDGEYIAILNSDDQFLPGKLKKQIDFLDAHSYIHAVFGYPRFINEKGRILDRSEHFYSDLFKQPNRSRFEWLNYFFKHQNALCHPTAMLRRSCYECVGYYDPRFAQIPDFDLWVRLLFKYEIHVMPEELINFRILAGEQNMSALRLDTLNRSLWELSHVLENYLSISSLAEYLAIFPEEAVTLKLRDPDLIPFYLAQLMLRLDTPSRSVYRVMGLNILFNMLSDPILKAKLEKDLNFTYIDFIKISGSYSFVQNAPPPPSFAKRLRKLASPTWVYNKIRSKMKSLT